jgi:hypothetical protein
MDAPVTEQFDKEHFIEVLEALHRDQTGLAAALNRVKDLIDSYDWIAESRGSYEWDDVEYMEEVGRCFDAIRAEIDYSLSHSGKAHQICCGKYRHVARHDKVPLQRRLRMGQFYNEVTDELMDLALIEGE